MTVRSGTVSPRRAEVDYSLLFCGLFLALGAQMAFHQLWLADWGLSAAEIGYVNAAGLVVRIAAGAWIPALSDRLGRPKQVMLVVAGVGCLAALAHLVADARWQLYALTVLLAAVFAALMPMSDAHGYAAGERIGFSYRRARTMGSVAFLSATFLVGMLSQSAGVDLVMLWMGAAFALMLLAALRAPFPGRRRSAAASEEEDAPPVGMRAFLGAGVFRLFMATVALIQSSHAVYYVYGSVHWSALGYSETLIGGLWALGVIAEILLFAFGRSVITWLGPVRALMAAGLCAAFRWSAMAVDPPLALLLALQLLHAGSFGLTHLATLEFIARAAPRGSTATAQGLTAASSGGAAMAVGALVAAQIYPVSGALAYLQGAVFAAASLALAARLGLVWRGERVIAPGPASAE